nr:Aspartyl/Asparaginyl beta-hydroxylase [uncultured organism]
MKWLLLIVFCASVLYVHLRGTVRLRPWRQLFDHSTALAPLNALMQLCSKAPRMPFVPLGAFPELAPLQQHWRTIRAEAQQLIALKRRQGATPSGDPNFDAFVSKGWKYFYLKWYDVMHDSALQLCPQTVALLQAIPAIRIATFAELPPGGRIASHRDPFAGWMRYHLGLCTPGDGRCWIAVDGERHEWCDGGAMLFDETYVHWAANDGERSRLILLCDIERPMRYRWAQALNRVLGRTMMMVASPPHVGARGAGSGVAGALAHAMIRFGAWRRRLKAWNRNAYRAALLAVGVCIGALLVLL